MKFTGELKFPEIDHPGVPVQFEIEGTQAELLVEGESLGRWSLYDVRARRLVASAFQIELDGTEVTFVADDPIDFAYRGVEHMAETWATLKSKRIASRGIAVRKSRRGTAPSRIEDMKAAMLANLEGQNAPRQLAGEIVMPSSVEAAPESGVDEGDWDRREAGSIPVVGEESEPVSEPEQTPSPTAEPDSAVQEQLALLEEEKRRIAAEWERLEEERRQAEKREADRLEAYRLEMERLRVEREQLRQTSDAGSEPVVSEPLVESAVESAVEPVVEEPTPVEEPVAVDEPVEPEPVEPEPVVEPVPVQEPVTVDEVGEKAVGVVDLNDLEDEADVEVPEPEPVAAGPVAAAAVTSRERSGLMGAVRAAFRAGSKDHAHQFIEAPGGIGITRYVCEECGYVSISA